MRPQVPCRARAPVVRPSMQTWQHRCVPTCAGRRAAPARSAAAALPILTHTHTYTHTRARADALEAERGTSSSFEPLPFHYLEVARALFRSCRDAFGPEYEQARVVCVCRVFVCVCVPRGALGPPSTSRRVCVVCVPCVRVCVCVCIPRDAFGPEYEQARVCCVCAVCSCVCVCVPRDAVGPPSMSRRVCCVCACVCV